MATIAITDTGRLDPRPALSALREAGHEALWLDTTDPVDVADRAAEASALIVSFTPINESLLAALPRLRVIATTTVGLDRIDVEAARRRGVEVCNLPSLASEEVAVHAAAGLLSTIRELPASHHDVAEGSWDYSALPLPPRISELTLGLIGMGRIAQRVARLAGPFFGGVVGHDPFLPAEAWPHGVEPVGLDELFRRSHAVSLHAPSTPETRGIVDARAIGLMPEPSYLVNVARGDLVDEGDLLAALESGRLRGAFLDVLAEEPPAANHVLLREPRVRLSPHAAFRSSTTVREYMMHPVREVLARLAPDAAAPGASDRT